MNSPEQSPHHSPEMPQPADQQLIVALEQIGEAIDVQIMRSLTAYYYPENLRLLDESVESFLSDETKTLLKSAAAPQLDSPEEYTESDMLVYEVGRGVRLALEMQLRLKYPELHVDSVESTHITFSTTEQLVDEVNAKYLIISFQREGAELKTYAAYSYISFDFTGEPAKREVIDSDITVIEGIVLQELKEDVALILQALAKMNQDDFSIS